MSVRVKKTVRNTLLGLLLLTGVAVLGWKLSASRAEPPGKPSLRQVNEESTLLPTPTDLPPTPTETLLPTPELSTPKPSAPLIGTWTGAPTYQAESQPGYDFLVSYDSSVWGLTENESGVPALVHRNIPYCEIVPMAGRGLPRGWTVDDKFRAIGNIQYEVITAIQNGVVQFVNYFGSDGIVLTGFQVSSQEQMDSCLQAAETVLASLSSLPAPTPTPTLTPTETPAVSPTP